MKLPSPLLRWFEQRQTNPCHRQLLVISGSQSWAEATVKALTNQQNIESALWVGKQQEDFDTIDIKDFRTKLGQEYDWLILDCFSGFRASAAMALSGTIKAQGTMLIICPELADWPTYEDPEQLNRTSFGFHKNLLSSRFIQYLTSSFKEDRSVAVLTAERFTGDICTFPLPFEPATYEEQKQAVSAVCKVAQGRNNRPLVLTADRGRGKSSALGIAAAALMQSATTTIWLTAPHIRNVEQVFSHSLRLLPDANFDKNKVRYQSSALIFKPIDLLLLEQNLPDLLFIDEASAIPVHILLKLAQKFTRIVFSSTVHGYEGSGRGFEIKFKQQLLKLRPEYKSLHISQPIRWYSEDVLERFWFSTLFYQSKLENNALPILNGPVECRYISQTELLADKQILAEVFSLLLDAHYQTSPDDLQRLLDSPEIKCFVLTQGNSVIGVAQLIEEGGEYLHEYSEQIAANSKRVKGHLVAQNIAASYDHAEFCRAKQWRVSRIAIKASHQRKGHATTLLKYIENLAKKEKVSFLTVAFGASPSLLPIWHQLGYLPVKISLKPEVSSGEHSCIHIKPLTPELNVITQEITAEFFNDLLFYMEKDLSSLSAEVLLEILMNTNNQAVPSKMSIVRQFINNTRTLSSCRRVLVFALLSQLKQIKQITCEQQNFLISLLFQNKTYQQVSAIYALTGKKQIEQRVRDLLNIVIRT